MISDRAATAWERPWLVLVASLREIALDRAAEPASDDGTLSAAIRMASAQRYLDSRDAVHARMRREGVATMDVTCTELSGVLVERYLAVKRAGRL
ncbi:hypothetical protein [Luteibacter sp. UNCMF331Sha3.1]|uniref:hypothetical protein n=1 Tax=Luteibacter sp. UNCMF331Sha3.1 TaxID=1502760 RepID=UPI0011136645|nr:hypothetical protein [Luteibacter sp. UNCMF331Sha3.1]